MTAPMPRPETHATSPAIRTLAARHTQVKAAVRDIQAELTRLANLTATHQARLEELRTEEVSLTEAISDLRRAAQ